MGHNKRLDTLHALIAQGYQAEVVCRCGHKVMMDPRVLLKECWKRHLGINSMAPLAHRMECSKCGGRPVRIGPIKR